MCPAPTRAGKAWEYNFNKWCCHQLRSPKLKSYQKNHRGSQEQYFSCQQTNCAFLLKDSLKIWTRWFSKWQAKGLTEETYTLRQLNSASPFTYFPVKKVMIKMKEKKPNCYLSMTFPHARRPFKLIKNCPSNVPFLTIF